MKIIFKSNELDLYETGGYICLSVPRGLMTKASFARLVCELKEMLNVVDELTLKETEEVLVDSVWSLKI